MITSVRERVSVRSVLLTLSLVQKETTVRKDQKRSFNVHRENIARQTLTFMKIAARELFAEQDLRQIKALLAQEDPIARQEHQSRSNVQQVTGDLKKGVKILMTVAPVLIRNSAQLTK